MLAVLEDVDLGTSQVELRLLVQRLLVGKVETSGGAGLALALGDLRRIFGGACDGPAELEHLLGALDGVVSNLHVCREIDDRVGDVQLRGFEGGLRHALAEWDLERSQKIQKEVRLGRGSGTARGEAPREVDDRVGEQPRLHQGQGNGDRRRDSLPAHYRTRPNRWRPRSFKVWSTVRRTSILLFPGLRS